MWWCVTAWHMSSPWINDMSGTINSSYRNGWLKGHHLTGSLQQHDEATLTFSSELLRCGD